MKYLFLTLASLIGLFQLVVFFQNLAGASDATIFYLTESADMNPGMIMFFGFILGGLGVFALIMYFTGGKLPSNDGEFGGSTEEW